MDTNIHQKELNNIFKVLPKLNLPELEEIMQKIIGIRKQKLPNILTQVETELLRKINKKVPGEIEKRYDFLLIKRKKEELTQPEHEELLELTGYMENQNVKRLENLIELARIRNITLDELIEDLELKPRLDVA